MLRRSLPHPWDAIGAALGVVLLGAGAVGLSGAGRSSEDVILIALAAIAVGLLWSMPKWLVLFAGALLPVQALDGASSDLIEVLRITVLLLAVLRYRSDLSGGGARLVVWFAALLFTLDAVQFAFGVVRDPLVPTLRMAALSLWTIAVAWSVARRTAAHRVLLLGFLAGSTFSAAVSLSQAAGVDVLRTADHGPDRYPGLALQAPGLAWHMVIAIFIGVAAVTTASSRPRRVLAGSAVALCVLALVACGAQGGLLGLGVGIVTCLVHVWRRQDHREVLRWSFLGVLGVVAAIGIATVAGFGTSSVAGVMGDEDKGYANERARLDAAQYGVEQLLESPLTGLGTDEYDARYDVRPHVLPLNAAVNTGILGFAIGAGLLCLLGWTVLRGPVDSTAASAWLGTTILAVMFTLACLTPTGPFSRIERLSVLLIAVVLGRADSPALSDHRRVDDARVDGGDRARV